MSYVEKINHVLKPANSRSPLVIDLFAGCGGLSLGFEAQGFDTHGFEMDADSCATALIKWVMQSHPCLHFT